MGDAERIINTMIDVGLIFEVIVGFIIIMYSLIKSIFRTEEGVKLSEKMPMQDMEEDGQPITQKTKTQKDGRAHFREPGIVEE